MILLFNDSVSLLWLSPMSLFISNPGLAFVPALLFIAAYIHHRVVGGRAFRPGRFVLLAAGCFWLLYALYEFSVQREFKPENVPIRVDLEFIGPALLTVTCLGVLAYLPGFPRRLSQSSLHDTPATRASIN
jgi:hypothetical protein